jgi:hypothetical protein
MLYFPYGSQAKSLAKAWANQAFREKFGKLFKGERQSQKALKSGKLKPNLRQSLMRLTARRQI